MRRQHLKTESLLGIDVCDIRADRAVSISLEALRTHEFDTVYFLSAVSSLYAQNTPWASDLINSSYLVLPGDQHTEMAVSHQQGSEGPDGQVSYTEEYMNRLLSRLSRDYRDLFAVLPQKDKLDTLEEHIREDYPNIRFEGMVFDEETEGGADSVVNEINAHIPDVLLLILPVEEQLDFLKQYSSMMNTRLCLCTESLQATIAGQAGQVPGWVQKLHLDRVYEWLTREEKFQRRIAESILKKKMNEDSAFSDAGQDKQN